MANVIYNSFKKDIQSGNINLSSDTIKVALVTSSYTPDQDAHTKFSDITNEVSGTGYTAGGAALSGLTVTQDNTNNRGVFSATNASWSSSTITAHAAILYKSTGTSSTSPLVAYIDFGADYSTSSSTFFIPWDTAGIIYLG